MLRRQVGGRQSHRDHRRGPGTTTLNALLGTYGHTRALREGRIAPPGVRLAFTEIQPVHRGLHRMADRQEFDVAEMALTTYILARSFGRPITALPVAWERIAPLPGRLEGTREVRSMADYLPPAWDWVREQVERYEGSGGKEGTTLRDTGLPVIVVTYTGRKTGAIRKAPLMRVVTGDGKYVLVASKGGAPENPAWYYSLREQPEVTIRDHEQVFQARIYEVTDPGERARLWDAAVKAYPPYAEYQERTSRQIPVFLAEPLRNSSLA